MAKIIGGTTATSVPVPDWNQNNPNRADYIKNKPDIAGFMAEVKRYKYDYDGNGAVDLNDAIYLLYHIEDKEAYPIPSWCDADFNGDGVVDESDATDCLNAVNYPATYPFIYDTAPNETMQVVANALKGTASGAEVVLKDVSPLPHEIGVKVSTSNELTKITDCDWSSWSKDGEYGDYTIAEKSWESDLGEGKLFFTDGSELDIGMCMDVSFDELNVGDVVRFIDEAGEGYWEAYLVKGFSGDPTTVKVTVSGAMESIYLGRPGDGDAGGSCFDSGETEFIVDRTGIDAEGDRRIYFTDGSDYWGPFGHLSPDDIKAGDRAYISYHYDEAFGEDVPSLYLAKGEYREPTQHTPNADGTVTGIIGDGTPITISNDKGAILEVEYNRDITKVVERLIHAVQDLGGSI